MSTAETLYYRCIPEFVTLDPDLHPFSSHLFTCIAHKAYLNNGMVQMTMEHLAEISRLSLKSVMRYLPPLEEKGYLRISRAPKGSKIPNIYEIVGQAAEVVVRKSKTEAEPAAEPPTSVRQQTQRPSMPKRGSQEPSATLKAQPSVGEASAFNRPPDPRESRTRMASEALQTAGAIPPTPDQVPDRPLTKEQEKQEKYEVLNVVDNEDTSPIFALKGVHPTVMEGWIDEYGANRVRDVLQGLARQKYVGNKGGWVRKALEDGWIMKGSASKEYVNDAQRYITGEYAAYINH